MRLRTALAFARSVRHPLFPPARRRLACSVIARAM
jgi:hypothetical protein